MNTTRVDLLMRWCSGELSFEQYIAMLDRVQPLTCLRDSNGDFVRDGDGRIVVVAAQTEQKQAA